LTGSTGGFRAASWASQRKDAQVWQGAGRDFFPDGSGQRFMRLNFSNATPEQIREGIRRIAEVCKAAASQPAVIAS